MNWKIMREKYGGDFTTGIDAALWINASCREENMKFKVPDNVNADKMTDEELRTKVQKGYDDIAAGRVRDAESAFTQFREQHGWN